MSYFSSGPEASSNGSLPTTQLNRVSLKLWTDMDFVFEITLCFGFKLLIIFSVQEHKRTGRDESGGLGSKKKPVFNN